MAELRKDWSKFMLGLIVIWVTTIQHSEIQHFQVREAYGIETSESRSATMLFRVNHVSCSMWPAHESFETTVSKSIAPESAKSMPARCTTKQEAHPSITTAH